MSVWWWRLCTNLIIKGLNFCVGPHVTNAIFSSALLRQMFFKSFCLPQVILVLFDGVWVITCVSALKSALNSALNMSLCFSYALNTAYFNSPWNIPSPSCAFDVVVVDEQHPTHFSRIWGVGSTAKEHLFYPFFMHTGWLFEYLFLIFDSLCSIPYLGFLIFDPHIDCILTSLFWQLFNDYAWYLPCDSTSVECYNFHLSLSLSLSLSRSLSLSLSVYKNLTLQDFVLFSPALNAPLNLVWKWWTAVYSMR